MKMRWFLIALVVLAMGSSCNLDPNVAKRKYLESGNKYFDKGKYKEASIMYRSALKKDARYGDAYYRLGLTLLKLNNPVAAARPLQRALELLPPGEDRNDTSGKVTDIYVAVYITDTRRDQPLERELTAYLERPEVSPFDKDRIKGFMAWKAGKLDDAIASFKNADAKRPTEPSLVLSLTQVLFTKARQEEAAKQPVNSKALSDEATQLAVNLIAKDKEFGAIYDVLYAEYLRRNLRDDAERIRKLKSDNNPKNLEFRIQLAAHYYLLGRQDDAVRVIEAVVANKQDFPNGREKAGDFYMLLHNYDKAIQYYKGGLGGTKDEWLNFQRKIADALISQDRGEEALALVEKQILKQYPKDSVALALRASLWLQTGDANQVQRAITEMEGLVSKLPQNAVLRYNLGRAHWLRDNLEQARTQFKAALDIQPDYLAARQALTDIHLRKGEFTQALQMADGTLAFAPYSGQARVARAQALQGVGKIDEARDELQALLKQSPSSPEVLFRLGLLESNAKNYPAATRLFDQCLQNATDNLYCIVGVAEGYSAQKQFDKALDFLTAQLKKDPERREIRLALANTAVLAEKYDMAVGLYKELIAKDSTSVELELRLAECYRRMQNTEAALEHFRRVRQLQPNNPDAAIWLALLLHLTGHEAEARDRYEDIIRLQPDNPVALNNLAYVIAEQGGDLDTALTYAQRAKQKAPNSEMISDTLAWIYVKKKLTASALTIYDELIAQKPNDPTFRYHRAMALLQKGEFTKAKTDLETALRNKPNPTDEAKIKEQLQKIG